MQYTLTLSRWHKVAERINAALKERETAVKTAFTATTISPWNREGVEEKAAEIARRGADDLANHNANDDRGRNRGAGELNRMNRRGADDPANHDANDDRGRHHRRHGETANGQTLNNRGRGGADDPANHDARDDRGRNRGPGNGGVTPTPDDHGNAGVGHR